MLSSYRGTRYACYIGYITQAVINNLAPFLFIVFQTQYALSYERLGTLILVNFITQLVVDALAARFVDSLGYRRPIVFAHMMAAAGLVLLAVLPGVIDNTFFALAIAVVVYAIGGGLLEVLVSPIVESLPTPQEEKAASMSLLHSFYCWGQLGVFLVSTLLLRLVGQDSWMLLPVLWAAIPLCNLFIFLKVPLTDTVPAEKRTRMRDLLRMPLFHAFLVLMLCAGASEQAMSQWASLFAEQGLGLSKVVGDILGPCFFALMMGLGRTVYGVWGTKIHLTRFMAVLAALCTGCYLLVSLVQVPAIAVLACGLCGFSVSIFWPGTFSLAAKRFPLGGTAMFGLFAMFGDLGCSAGPWLTGLVADRAIGQDGVLRAVNDFLFGGSGGLNTGLLLATIFPVVLLLTLWAARERRE